MSWLGWRLSHIVHDTLPLKRCAAVKHFCHNEENNVTSLCIECSPVLGSLDDVAISGWILAES